MSSAQEIGQGYAERRDAGIRHAHDNIASAMTNLRDGRYDVAAACLREAAIGAASAAVEQQHGEMARMPRVPS